MRSLATSGDLMAFERSLDQERLVVAMHRGSGEATLDLPGIATGRTVLGDPSRCQTTSQGVRVLFKGPDAVVIAPGPGRSG
jgi:hypothetical protein